MLFTLILWKTNFEEKNRWNKSGLGYSGLHRHKKIFLCKKAEKTGNSDFRKTQKIRTLSNFIIAMIET